MLLLRWILAKCGKSKILPYHPHLRCLCLLLRSEFGLAFLDAKERCNARTRHGSFDTSVIEINKDDLKVFLETLVEAADK